MTWSLGTVGGGGKNTAGAFAATVAGGYGNTASNITLSNYYATVGGGNGNTASGFAATVGGGDTNTASRFNATVGGGAGNSASGDLATVGGGGSNTASGIYATVGGGNGNMASGVQATVGGGRGNRASGDLATVPGGVEASASLFGQLAYASGAFAAVGTAQASLFVLRRTTIDATQSELFLDGFAARLTLAAGRTMTFDILVVARSTGGQSAGYQARGVIENDGGTTSFIGAPTITPLGEDDAGWDVTVQADDTNDALGIQVTGVDATSIRWVAVVRTAEVAQ